MENSNMQIIREDEINEYLARLKQGGRVIGNSSDHMLMHYLSQRAIKITAELNNSYHDPEGIRKIISELTGREIDSSFTMFPPFYTDCGMNTFIGKNVFINSGCHFQDQGGVYIGDGTLIGSQVVIATINHDIDPAHRGDNLLASVHIGKNVWIGSHSTILPGVSIGDNAVVAAGAVVAKDVEANTIVGGVPAKVLKKISSNGTKEVVA